MLSLGRESQLGQNVITLIQIMGRNHHSNYFLNNSKIYGF